MFSIVLIIVIIIFLPQLLYCVRGILYITTCAIDKAVTYWYINYPKTLSYGI